MFRKMKNIDSAFRYIRGFTMLVILLCACICCFAMYWSFNVVNRLQDRVYVLAQGQALQATASGRKENLAAEARDHISRFHELFFTLDPDEKSIQENLGKAMYLADGSAKKAYDNLREKDFYTQLIAANVNQTIRIDSIQIDIIVYPHFFRLYASQLIVRPTSQTTRSLVSQGSLRQISRSENNPHGFLIERWEIVENKDLKTQNRK